MLRYEASPSSGLEAVVTAEINGSVVTLAEITAITATIDFNKTTYRVMGDRAERHKYAGWTGSGSLTYHWMSPRFVRIIIEAAKTGIMPFLTINITNNDPSTSAGTQTVKISQVGIDGGDIAKMDVNTELLSGECAFTFSEVDGMEYFKEVA